MNSDTARRFGWIVGLLAAIGITLWLQQSEPSGDADLVSVEPEAVTMVEEPVADRYTAPQAQPMPEVNPLAARLHDPALSAEDDVATVHQLLVQMRTFWKSDPRPMGLNEEFTRALIGDNPMGLPFLSPDHPAINDEGQLTDRRGTPYHFHPLATDRVEIRSAGPDGRLFTDDDALYAPWKRMAARLNP